MPSSIQFNNLINGQEITLPYQVTGRITILPNEPAAMFTDASRQIDSNPLVSIAGNCSPAPGPTVAGPSDFAFAITALECPLPNVNYSLSIHSWDSQSQAVTLASVTFKAASNMPTPTPTPTPSTSPSPGLASRPRA